MTIQHEDEGQYGRFFFQDASAEAELTYRRKDGLLQIDHTGVEEALEGKGIGKALVERAVEWARESGLKIQPFCSFARTLLTRDPVYADLLVLEGTE